MRARGSQRGMNFRTALRGDVRILAAPDHQQLAFDLPDAVERVVVHAFSEAPLVDIGRVKAGRRENLRIHRGAESQMAPDADAHDANAARAVFVAAEKG